MPIKEVKRYLYRLLCANGALRIPTMAATLRVRTVSLLKKMRPWRFELFGLALGSLLILGPFAAEWGERMEIALGGIILGQLSITAGIKRNERAKALERAKIIAALNARGRQ